MACGLGDRSDRAKPRKCRGHRNQRCHHGGQHRLQCERLWGRLFRWRDLATDRFEQPAIAHGFRRHGRRSDYPYLLGHLAHTRGSHAVDPDDRVPGGFDAHFGRRQRHPYPRFQQHHPRRRFGGPCDGHFRVRPRSLSTAASGGSDRGVRGYAVLVLRPVPHRLRHFGCRRDRARTGHARAPRQRAVRLWAPSASP